MSGTHIVSLGVDWPPQKHCAVADLWLQQVSMVDQWEASEQVGNVGDAEEPSPESSCAFCVENNVGSGMF